MKEIAMAASKFKYIIFKSDLPKYILIPELMKHSDFIKNINEILNAGFVQFSIVNGSFTNELSAYCYGESKSLNIKSRGKEDSDLINRTLMVH